MLLDGRASGANLSGKAHLLEEVMAFSLSPPPAKINIGRTHTLLLFNFLLSKQTNNSSSTSSSLSELMTSLDSQSFFAAISI